MIKILAWLLVALNAYMGGNYLLNGLGVLQDSKYGVGATWLYAIILVGMSGAGAYFCWVKADYKLAFWIGAGAWILLLTSLVLNMIFGKYN